MNKYKEKRKAKKSICRMKVKETKRKRDRKKRIINRKVNKPKERHSQKKENETDRIETKREKTKRIAVNKHNVKQSETGELKYVFKRFTRNQTELQFLRALIFELPISVEIFFLNVLWTKDACRNQVLSVWTNLQLPDWYRWAIQS